MKEIQMKIRKELLAVTFIFSVISFCLWPFFVKESEAQVKRIKSAGLRTAANRNIFNV
jgi:hypothetical protein